MSIDAEATTATALKINGQAATLNGSDLNVVIERDVEVLDEDGQLSEVVNLAYFLESALPAWDRGDTLTLAAGGTYKMQQTVNFDGVMRVVSVE